MIRAFLIGCNMIDPFFGSVVSGLGSLVGSIFSGNSSEKNAKAQMQMQREFAQNGIQWRVADAKKAGIHPLYAIGANTTSYSPVSVGDTSIGSGISAMGQDIGRAISASSTKDDRFTAEMQQLQLQRGSLENQLLASQLAKQNAQIGPPMPNVASKALIPGQGNAPSSTPNLGPIVSDPLVTTQPATVTASRGGYEAGVVPEVGFSGAADGSISPVMSKDAKERLEEDFLGMLAWNLRNRAIPSITTPTLGNSDRFVPEGYDGYIYDPITQSYVPYSMHTPWYGFNTRKQPWVRRPYGPPRGMGRH